jgi:hypothetical protein
MLKIFVSDHTFRTEAEQLKTLRDMTELSGAPLYRPADMSAMFRKTTRKETDTYYAASIACFAPTREKFEEFIAECRKFKICLGSIEEGIEWTPRQSTDGIVNAWRLARIDGAAQVGGQRNAAKWKDKVKGGIEKARPLWVLPSKQHSIKDIEEISGIARGTIVRALGNRVPAQIAYQAAQKRKERRNAKR